MAHTTLSGNDVSIYKRTGTGPDVYKLLVCGTDATLTMGNEVITSKTKCGTTKKAGIQTWDMSFTGEVDLTPGVTELSLDDIYTDFAAKTAFRYAFKNADGSFGYMGDAVVTKLDVKAPTDGVVTFDITLSGSGDIAPFV